jgi:hypothetical protein
MIDNKIVIAKEKYDDETKMINLFFNEIIFMNNVEQFKKYYHGMSVGRGGGGGAPRRRGGANCCQQHYIFTLYKTRVP